MLALTENRDPPDDLSTVTVTWEELPFGRLAALPIDPGDADAALAENLNAVLPQVSFRVGNRRIQIAGALRVAEVPPPAYVVLTRHGVIRATFVGMTEHTERYFSSQTPLTFEHCIASNAVGGDAFVPGDSGAALVGPDGRLLGIHFAGTPGGSETSYAIHAAVALGSFRRKLAIW